MSGTRDVLDEQRLLQLARQLDEAALSTIFDSYYEPLYRYIYRHTGVATAAEDLVAEVFQSFLEELKIQRGPTTNLKGWLYRVAHNLIVDDARRNKHRIHEPLDENLHGSNEEIPEKLQQSVAKRLTEQALGQLTDKQREVLVLRYIQGLEIEDVARALNMTPGTVKSLQFRGLEAMRRYLKENGIQNEMDL
jgi:RNA polymerase sigma-70 factor (ECF subfamily)